MELHVCITDKRIFYTRMIEPFITVSKKLAELDLRYPATAIAVAAYPHKKAASAEAVYRVTHSGHFSRHCHAFVVDTFQEKFPAFVSHLELSQLQETAC